MSRIFGAVTQNGYVVRDLDSAIKHWVDALGVGPWFYFEDVQVEDFRYRGEPSDARISVALANSGDLQIELIQPSNDAPSMYRDFLAAGHEGLQHMCYWTTEYQDLYDNAIDLGYVVGQEGKIGGEHGRFAYFETQGHPGTVVEISDVSGPKRAVFDFIRKSSIGWDGSKPIRPMGGK
ncbi:glyoxalase [Aeromicrobium sp. PE09-221]|uniref:VOC family protein n=1 Tax=Aeromicrobium sp. PE09-221 TaxID=1898043 RepID=UPI000B3E7713|nr:VOC family protein [Aeromicrobium sp. PE09-221]OUZ10291.1 glyoxalase [Aeromicrobium sp. PE09-221]